MFSKLFPFLGTNFYFLSFSDPSLSPVILYLDIFLIYRMIFIDIFGKKKKTRWPGIGPGSQERQSYMIPLHYQRFTFK